MPVAFGKKVSRWSTDEAVPAAVAPWAWRWGEGAPSEPRHPPAAATPEVSPSSPGACADPLQDPTPPSACLRALDRLSLSPPLRVAPGKSLRARDVRLKPGLPTLRWGRKFLGLSAYFFSTHIPSSMRLLPSCMFRSTPTQICFSRKAEMDLTVPTL